MKKILCTILMLVLLFPMVAKAADVDLQFQVNDAAALESNAISEFQANSSAKATTFSIKEDEEGVPNFISGNLTSKPHHTVQTII